MTKLFWLMTFQKLFSFCVTNRPEKQFCTIHCCGWMRKWFWMTKLGVVTSLVFICDSSRLLKIAWTSSWQGSKQTNNLVRQALVREVLNSLVVWPRINSNEKFSIYQLKPKKQTKHKLWKWGREEKRIFQIANLFTPTHRGWRTPAGVFQVET